MVVLLAIVGVGLSLYTTVAVAAAVVVLAYVGWHVGQWVCGLGRA